MTKNLWMIIIIWLVSIACSTKNINSQQEIYAWINDVENGFIQIKQIDNVKLSVKFIPPQLLAIRDIDAGISERSDFDSLVAFHSQSRAFIVQIGPVNEEKKGNIMYSDLTSAEDYKLRVQDLNYHLDKYISLKINKYTFQPVIHLFENTYGLGKVKNMYVVFAPDDDNINYWNGEELSIVFEDKIFNSGTNTFSFLKKDLDQLPEIKPALINSL